jgi:hypothetical protein
MAKWFYTVVTDAGVLNGFVSSEEGVKVDLRKLVLKDANVAKEDVRRMKFNKVGDFTKYRYEVLLGSCSRIVSGEIAVKNAMCSDTEGVRGVVYQSVSYDYPEEVELSLVNLDSVGRIDLLETVEKHSFGTWMVVKD